MVKITRATAGLGAGVLVLAGVLAGCSDDDGGDKSDGKSDGKSGGGDSSDTAFADQGYDDIKQAAIAAMGTLTAVHVDAEISSDGKDAALDLSMAEDGSCTGTVSFGGISAEVLQTADGAWYKPDEGLLEQQYGAQADELGGFIGDKWVADPSGQVTGSNCDLAGFIAQVTSDEKEEKDPQVAGVEELDGDEVVKLTFTNDDGDGTVYVLTEGDHFITKFTVEGDDPGTVTFSGFNEDVAAEAPAADDVVDLADFKG
jgi:hypothetical protein